ncbi:MSMEG_1061 family FMN-dependent PPOX-type flavoprotein [Streptomyces sp. NPDC003077]|uniref:MSMEG_1061 family FMN-dependent PPOX-type flavoprotein n=1 Tax=Streptomyces sp. NPDC003077 TaxID=3154443 RepID=UPI0033A98969
MTDSPPAGRERRTARPPAKERPVDPITAPRPTADGSTCDALPGGSASDASPVGAAFDGSPVGGTSDASLGDDASGASSGASSGGGTSGTSPDGGAFGVLPGGGTSDASPGGGVDGGASDVWPDGALDLWDVRGPAPERTAADAYRAIGMERVREILGYPQPFIAEKKDPFLGDFMRRFIAHSTFFCLATADDTGAVDASPKGDPPGAVRILDPWTLAIPDRPGNRTADTFENITRNPAVGLVFFVPGVRETARVNGEAFVTDDPGLLERLGAEGKPAVLATIVKVREAFFQCGKAVIRAGLWTDTPRGLADALTLGGNFYAQVTAQMAQKMAATLGSGLGSLGAIVEDHYQNDLF